jgi:hypothetical protein
MAEESSQPSNNTTTMGESSHLTPRSLCGRGWLRAVLECLYKFVNLAKKKIIY